MSGSTLLQRLGAPLDRPVPVRFWAPTVALIAAWWLVPAVLYSIPTHFVDWLIYHDAASRWIATGTPYEPLAANWNPDVQLPYIYPPSSWPLLVLVLVLPGPLLLAAFVPFVVRQPRIVWAPVVAAFVALSFGPAFYWGNVNVLVAALIVLTALPRTGGGVALALAVALKGYPVVLLPLFWRDAKWARAFIVTCFALAAVGTVLFGPDAWIQWIRAVVGEGSLSGSINPLLGFGAGRYIVAGAIAVVGLLVASPTIALIGVTLLFQGLSIHYLLTFAAAAMIEPGLRGRRLGLPPVPRIRRAIAPGQVSR